MSRLWPALAVVLCAAARGAAPSYSAAGIVNTPSYAPAPFAPNGLVTIFGADLADAERGVVAGDIAGNKLPTVLVTTRVYINTLEAPLLYVSEKQINFVIPESQALKPVAVRVVRNGQSGPEVTLDLAAAAPALFVAGGVPVATHADGSLITADKPSAPGETVVIYLAGLGKTPIPSTGDEIPHNPLEIADRASLRVTLNGVAIDNARILYGGVTPGCAGVYQINLTLPTTAPADPELRVFVGDPGSQAGLKLPLRLPGLQLSRPAGR